MLLIKLARTVLPDEFSAFRLSVYVVALDSTDYILNHLFAEYRAVHVTLSEMLIKTVFSSKSIFKYENAMTIQNI